MILPKQSPDHRETGDRDPCDSDPGDTGGCDPVVTGQ
jgi:hypothetical protein